jgi:putative effector of murein hydrolase
MSYVAAWACLAATVALYLATKRLYRRRGAWWCYPLLAAPALLIGLIVATGIPFQTYMARTQWLLFLLGPATIAFAVPLYERRALLREHAAVIILAVVASVALTLGSSMALAQLVGLDETLARSLAPHSLTTPLAIAVSADLGGKADLAAVFAAVTGVAGIAVGQAILRCFPPRTRLAAGALLGAGASGAGVAKAHEIGAEEGAIASLVMILGGILSLLAAPLLATAAAWL